VTRDPRCPDCGHEGRYRDTVTRPLTDLPVAGYPLVLRVAVSRYRCLTPYCGRAVFNQSLGLTTWLANQPPAFRDQVDVMAMDGFGGYKTAATEVLPEATTVTDPFHVVALAGAKLDLTRQRIQQQT
jgi:transposase